MRLWLVAIGAMLIASASAEDAGITPVATLPGFVSDDLAAAFIVFRSSCAPPAVPPTRPAVPKPPDLAAVCNKAMALKPKSAGDARAFFEANFTARRVGAADGAFFTGYYEPVVEGSLVKTSVFPTPLYAPPTDLVMATPGHSFLGLDPALAAARHLPDGRLAPMPDRAAIDGGALAEAPIVYLRSPVEAFFVQVQGSARIKLQDGRLRRLVYAGRNGYPYTSIGKVLVDTLRIPPADMGMAQLKAWIEANGQGPQDAGTKLMQRNRSYIFFAFDESLPPSAGPIGGEGVSLTALRSLAIDRAQWPYGLPFYVDATLPWAKAKPTPFQRLMVGQDTGSAIVGRTRADIFLGTGEAAAARAGAIRDHGSLYVLWPRGEGTSR